MCTTAVSASDRRFMRRAIVLARTVAVPCGPTKSASGCTVVESGHIVAEDFTRMMEGHMLSGRPRKSWSLAGTGRSHVCDLGAVFDHRPYGSCCDRIVNSRGIRRVVIGCEIPIRRMRGARFGCCASMASRWLWC